MKIKLVIFDHDMTIVNSSAAITAGMNAIAKRNGLPAVSPEEVLRGIALPLNDAFMQLWGRADPVWTQHYRESVYDLEYTLIKPFPDTVDTLLKLNDMGFKLAVASNRFNPSEALDKTGLLKYFDAVVGLIDKVEPKPSPDMLNVLVKKFGITSDEALYVGDALVDMQAAKSASVRGIGVATGNYGAEALRNSGAWKTIDRLGDVVGCLTD